MPRAARQALIHQRRDRDFPSTVYFSDQIFLRHTYVVVEYFVESRVARYLDQRPNGDAGRLHVDEQIRDTPVFGRLGVGAHQQHLPVRAMGEAGPYLLAVDDE